MAKKTTTGSMWGVLGNRLGKGIATHKNDETSFGNVELPADVNGIAQLTGIKIGTYGKGANQGKPFWQATGVVVTPAVSEDGIPIKGLQTRIQEPLHDTPTRTRKTVEDHMGWVLNEMRKLGLDTSTMTEANADAMTAALVQAKPFFRFRTWKGEKTKEYPNPMTNHNWEGACEYSPEDGDDDGMETAEDEVVDTETTAEDTEETMDAAEVDYASLAEQADAGDEEAQATIQATAIESGYAESDIENAESWTDVVSWFNEVETTEETAEETTEEETEETEGEEIDYAGLGEAADSGDNTAATQLTELCESAGLSMDDYSESTWTELAEAIESTLGTEEEEEEETSPDFEPAKGEVYLYLPPKAKKPVECEVTLVFASKRTVNIKNLVNKMIYKGVSWDALQTG